MNRLSLNRAAVELPFEEFAHLCELLESSFPQHSINKLSQNNRLKRLWFAENWLSTIELLTLANSVRVMSEVDRKWTENHTKKILGKSTNEQIGSVFELNCATMLSEANLKVKPGRNNSPGYDLEVVYDDEHRLFLSLKNHDISSFENGFKMTSESLFSTINQIFSPTGVPTFVMIDFSQYPEPGVWKCVEDFFCNTRFESNAGFAQPCPDVSITYNELRPEFGKKFALKPFSSQVIIKAKFHKNEQNNFVSKLEHAAQNMRDKLGRKQNSTNVVCMRLHPTASVDYLERFARDILEADKDSGIDGVIFYQPSVVRKTDNSSVVSHFFRCIDTSRWNQWKHGVLFRPFIGESSNVKSRLIMRGDSKTLLDDVSSYIYQRGELNYQFEYRTGTQTLSNLAPGILSNLTNEEGEVLKGKIFSEQEDLLLI